MSKRYNLSVDDEESLLIENALKLSQLRLSDFLKLGVLQHISSMNLTPESFRELLNRKIKRLCLLQHYQHMKEEHRNYYLFRNTYRTLTLLSTTDYALFGHVNMHMINHVLDMAEKAYALMPEHQQENMKPSFECLQRLRNPAAIAHLAESTLKNKVVSIEREF